MKVSLPLFLFDNLDIKILLHIKDLYGFFLVSFMNFNLKVQGDFQTPPWVIGHKNYTLDPLRIVICGDPLSFHSLFRLSITMEQSTRL